jgi:hypothetical protein
VGEGAETQTPMRNSKAKSPECLPSPACVVKVGGGRGFVIKHRTRNPPCPGVRLKRFHESRLVITAAHCLPDQLPPPFTAALACEKTYQLLGTLDGSKSGIWAECLFVNPVADIAVLGAPDGQADYDEDAYWELTNGAPFLRIDKARSGPGWALSLDGQWTRTTLEVRHGIYGFSLSVDPVKAGMSGSPILNDSGLAVGIAVLGTETTDKNGERTEGRSFGQVMLRRELPGWLL